jgi:cysteine sulfinate desulfinase/cysteine desulfurase-like protein
MFELREQVKNSILSLTNIKEQDYDDYDIYFSVSGSQAIDTIVKMFMENSEKSGKIVSTNTEHISTMVAAGQYNVDVVDVLEKKYNLKLDGARLIHCIVANNETGIIY